MNEEVEFRQIKVEKKMQKEMKIHLICTKEKGRGQREILVEHQRSQSDERDGEEGKGEPQEDPAPALNCFVLLGKAPDACSQATA